MRTALSIAGTDPSGGAGIQADLKTMTMNGVFAMSAITALVAQNTTGVREIVEMTPDFLEQQIDVVFEDIPPDAVKIGMVASCGLIEKIAERLRFYQARNVVVDPVMVATSGDRLISEEAVDTMKACLLPLATLMTPTIISMRAALGHGSTERTSITPTPTEPAAPCPAPSRPIWPKALTCLHPFDGRRSTSPERWGPCWIWGRAGAPCGTISI